MAVNKVADGVRLVSDGEIEIHAPRDLEAVHELMAVAGMLENVLQPSGTALIQRPSPPIIELHVNEAGAANLIKTPSMLEVDVSPGEGAVLLAETDDGLFAWIYPEKTGLHGLMVVAPGTLTFDLSPPPGAGLVPNWRRGDGLFRWLRREVRRTITVVVLRFVAGMAVDAAVKALDYRRRCGLVSLAGPPETWTPESTIPPLPSDKPLLLMCHGTFSSTIGTFGDLNRSKDGKAFLTWARERYGAVLGYDHRTASDTPSQNARGLLAALEAHGLPQNVTMDAVAFSRGALVYRVLAESMLAETRPDIVLRRAVFVGATNAGTHLAEPDHWSALIDFYTNLILGAARVAGVLTGGAVPSWTKLALETIGGLVKMVTEVGVNDRRAPGLSAMQPNGDTVKALNQASPSLDRLAHYFAYVSDFKPGRSPDSGDRPARAIRILDRVADELFGSPNDLVVHTASMSDFGTAGPRLRETCAPPPNDPIYHTVYFKQSCVAKKLMRWLDHPESI